MQKIHVRNIVGVAALAWLLSCLSLAGAADVRRPVSIPSAGQLDVMCATQLDTTRARVKDFEEGRYDNDLLRSWNRMLVDLNSVWQPASVWAAVSPDPDLRESARQCDLAFTSLFSRITQSSPLYEQFKRYVPVDTIDRSARESILLDFTGSGVNLPPEERQKALALTDEIGRLQQQFETTLRNDRTRLSFSAEELRGVDPRFLAHQPRDANGHYVFGFDNPEIDTIMDTADNEAVRQRYSYALSRRGGPENLAVLNRIVVLRKQLAQLMGYASFADWELRSHMAGSADQVNGFLGEIKRRVDQLERQELDVLKQEKARITGIPTVQLGHWDVSYYKDHYIASHYNVDQAEVRRQFPVEPTVDWLILVLNRLYGLDIQSAVTLPLWHGDVKAYDVRDKVAGTYLGSFYLDLYPREGKTRQDGTLVLRSGSSQEGVTPLAVMMANFNRDGLNEEEFSVLFHEVGHVMHAVLSRTRYQVNAGLNVKSDFVDASSQMFEEWGRRPEVLALFKEACPSCRPADMALIERMNKARQFGRGIEYGRQWLYAAYDMALAGTAPADAMETWVTMESRSPLGYTEGTQFPGIFEHIVGGGYAAGYYGYMWSQVLALDMLSAFGRNAMNPAVGMRFRKRVLEKGGELPPQELVRSFLGRNSSPEAFFAEIAGQRTGH